MYASPPVYSVCSQQRESQYKSLARPLLYFTRFWGIFSSVVVLGVGAELAYHQHFFGYFYLSSALVIFCLEVSWLCALFQSITSNPRGGENYCLDNCLRFRLWRRSILYTAFAVFLFISPRSFWLSTLAGCQLLLLSALYLVQTYWLHRKDELIPSPRLLTHSQTPSQDDLDKYDDITDILDDSFPAPVMNTNITSEMEHDAMLEI